MSICTVKTTLERIESAPAESPIAVFDIGSDEKVDARFHNTVLIGAPPGELIGVFDTFSDREGVRKAITKVLSKNARTVKDTEELLARHLTRYEPAEDQGLQL